MACLCIWINLKNYILFAKFSFKSSINQKPKQTVALESFNKTVTGMSSQHKSGKRKITLNS